MIQSCGHSYRGNQPAGRFVTVIMRTLPLLLLGAVAASSQPFSAGLKLGTPLTDFFNTVQNSSSSVPNRYIIGLTAELHLPASFALEGDVLFRHLNFVDQFLSAPTTTTTDRATSSAWEFPILLKYRFHAPLVRPYVDAGVAWDPLSGLTDTVTQTVLHFSPTTSNSSKPSSLTHNTTMGFVLGGGVDIHALVIHISPEIRYTRWGSSHFNLSGILASNQNQAEFLVGITF